MTVTDLIGFKPQPWMADALCAYTDPEAFFPNKGESNRNAKRVCADCPVRLDCLRYAIDTGQRYGVWGGLSERELRKHKRPRDGVRRCREGHDLSDRPKGQHCLVCARRRDNTRNYNRRARRRQGERNPVSGTAYLEHPENRSTREPDGRNGHPW